MLFGLRSLPVGKLLKQMLTAREKHASTVVDGKIYVFGGVGEGSENLTSVEEYDPANDRS